MSVAALLGYKQSALSYIVFQIPAAGKYKTFEIKKKGDGKRLCVPKTLFELMP
jgi:RNA-directed DNA polymerase